jgi:hypothetical protein
LLLRLHGKWDGPSHPRGRPQRVVAHRGESNRRNRDGSPSTAFATPFPTNGMSAVPDPLSAPVSTFRTRSCASSIASSCSARWRHAMRNGRRTTWPW